MPHIARIVSVLGISFIDECHYITKTYLYNFDPLKPHFYIVKLGFIGVYIIFLISAQNIDCGYSLEPPRRGGSNEYPQCVLSRNKKNIRFFFYLKIFIFLVVEFSVYLNRFVFVMHVHVEAFAPPNICLIIELPTSLVSVSDAILCVGDFFFFFFLWKQVLYLSPLSMYNVIIRKCYERFLCFNSCIFLGQIPNIYRF